MKKLLLLLADGFEEIEALGTADVLRRTGLEITLAGLAKAEVSGSHGIKVTADTVFDAMPESTVDAFDGVILPGGLPGTTWLYQSEKVRETVKRFAAAGKLTAAICAAPIVLGAAGVLADRRFTMYPAPKLVQMLPEGCIPSDALAVSDGNVVTGKGPGASFAFASEIAAFFGMSDAVEQVLQEMFVTVEDDAE